ncbi:hypothetical protein [Lignipirellula cremea]|uniref:hypothetical protein n=1 Tax=Lignipirellula cremea TaxID=2528010 RepID=UPI001E3A8F1E|nr:hypothetical protein [Lignipirellula cremea]
MLTRYPVQDARRFSTNRRPFAPLAIQGGSRSRTKSQLFRKGQENQVFRNRLDVRIQVDVGRIRTVGSASGSVAREFA